MWQCPINVSEFKVNISSTDLLAFIPLLRSQMLFQGYSDVLIMVYILKLCTLSGLSHFFMCTFQRVLKLQLRLQYIHLYNCTHHTDTRSAPLVARRRSNFLYLHASVSSLLPLPLLLVSLIFYNCTLLLDHFTLVPASVSCHSHPVGAGREGTVHSLVWTICLALTATSHQECYNRRNVLVGPQSYLLDLEWSDWLHS